MDQGNSEKDFLAESKDENRVLKCCLNNSNNRLFPKGQMEITSKLIYILTLYSPKSRFLSSSFLCRSTCKKSKKEFIGVEVLSANPVGNQLLSNWS